MRLPRAGQACTRPLNCGVMRHRAVGIAAAVAILGGGIAISIHVEGPHESAEVPVVNVSERAPAERDRSRVDVERSTADNQPDIREMSQSFRHTTFLTAIRRVGFYCDDVVEAHESAEGLWVASCRDLGGYTVSVGGVDVVRVEPIAHNVDAVF
jgi:hypothetical protein